MGFIVGANSARTNSTLPEGTSNTNPKATVAVEKPGRVIPAVVTPTTEEDAVDPGETETNQEAELDDGNAQFDTGAYTTWSEEEYPNYYRIVGVATIDSDLQPGEVTYSGLDYLGRSGRAVACVTYDLMMEGIARSRDDMSSIEPSGWGHNEEVDIKLTDGSFYHGYLFNRSHLIAKSLGGSDIHENLVTGTRMQNVGANNPAGGMLFCEQTTRNWLEGNPDGWVLYAATPIYEGDELVCRSVIVDMVSSDRSLNMQVEVYNAALGFEIDYATGEFTAIG
ncbi:MAG: DNA/RNA non-specific endonuclease [Atopobiaceae bacterium]|nr:DNA/RNA non-specific endonuclease [Atopobiaceae bacterium]